MILVILNRRCQNDQKTWWVGRTWQELRRRFQGATTKVTFITVIVTVIFTTLFIVITIIIITIAVSFSVMKTGKLQE